MATSGQKITFADIKNKIVRTGIREKVYGFYKGAQAFSFSTRMVASRLFMNYRQVQPRISELLSSGLIIEVGTTKENKETVSLFKYNPSPKLFGYGSKSKLELFKMAVKSSVDSDTYDAINDEFKRLEGLNSNK